MPAAKPRGDAWTQDQSDPGGTTRNPPVIILTYPNAGGRRLQALLEPEPELTCTTSTGVLAACEQAAVAWKKAEGRPAKPLSVLAATSIRSMATQMMLMMTVRTGRPRWCELAAADPAAAGVFLDTFPGTRFLCLHRSCPDLVSAVLLASPWGLSGDGFAPYVAAYPGSTVAALTAWWIARARPVLDFERGHPGACLRVAAEDLDAAPDQALAAIRGFLGLSGPGPQPGPPDTGATGEAGAAGKTGEAGAATLPAELPLDQLPAPLLAQAEELHAALGYPPLARG